MSSPHDAMIHAALIAYWRGSGLMDEQRMANALAAAYRADAEHVTHTGAYAPAIIETWLRQRAAELDGQSDGGRE